MKLVNIDDEAKYEKVLKATCERLDQSLQSVKSESVLIRPGIPRKNEDLPILFDQESRLIDSKAQIPADITNDALVWRSQLEEFIQFQDVYYILDIHFSNELPRYGFQIAHYLKLRGVPKHRIVLLTSYRDRADTMVNKEIAVPWGVVFEKRQFPLGTAERESESAARFTTEILTLWGSEILSLGHVVESGIIGQSEAIKRVKRLCVSVANRRSPVLFLGESGTGKELFARFIHENSERKQEPFVAVNCSALPANLMESELFGHQKGSFTGAHADKKGLFETANGGSLLLDEIAELDISLQPKLLRALQERRIRRVGDVREITTSARVIAATHRNLRDMILAGTFREDLFYRLSVVPIEIPPLRERHEDVTELANHFLRQKAAESERPVFEIADDALNALRDYSWPGNVRQLENAIERAVLTASGNAILLENLPPELTTGQHRSLARASLETVVDQVDDWDRIEAAIKGTGKHFSAGFLRLIRELDIDENSRQLVWQTLVSGVRIICDAKSVVKSGKKQSLVQIVALLHSLMDQARHEDNRLFPDILSRLCCESGAINSSMDFEYFKTRHGNFAGLGNSRQSK